MDLILEAKDANEWSYRGEGAANLVLSYNGTSSELVGKVIRVQKASNDGSIYENGHLAWSEHEQIMWKDAGSMVTAPTKDIAEQQFLQCVMIPLLGSEYVDAGRHILVSREFLEAVKRNCLLLRPNWRILASKVNMACDSVHLMSDHSVFPYSNSSEGPCICVEIKPKCGFLPSSRFVSEKNAIKKKVSRFKMHQALKLQIRQKTLALFQKTLVDIKGKNESQPKIVASINFSQSVVGICSICQLFLRWNECELNVELYWFLPDCKIKYDPSIFLFGSFLGQSVMLKGHQA